MQMGRMPQRAGGGPAPSGHTPNLTWGVGGGELRADSRLMLGGSLTSPGAGRPGGACRRDTQAEPQVPGVGAVGVGSRPCELPVADQIPRSPGLQLDLPGPNPGGSPPTQQCLQALWGVGAPGGDGPQEGCGPWGPGPGLLGATWQREGSSPHLRLPRARPCAHLLTRPCSPPGVDCQPRVTGEDCVV